MASGLHIDTLKFARKLREAGLDEKAAEAIAEGLSEACALATREDVLALRSDFFELRAELGKLKAELFKRLWVMAAGIVSVTVLLIKILP